MGKFNKPGSDWHKINIYVDGPGDTAITNALVHLKSLVSDDEYWSTTGPDGFATIPNVHKRVTSCLIEVTANGFDSLTVNDVPMNMGISQLVYLINPSKPTPEPKPWELVSDEKLKRIIGNFCGITISGLPFHRNQVFYSPTYLLYSDEWRKIIRDEYKKRGYTHMPIVIHNGVIYGSWYPTLDLTVEERRRRIIELWNDGIIPIANAMPDEGGNLSPDFFKLADLIRIWFPKWEMNEPDQNHTTLMCDHIEVVCEEVAKYGDLVFVHFSPKHSSGSGIEPLYFCPTDGERFPDQNHFCEKHGKFAVGSVAGEADANARWWQWAKLIGVDGIFVEAASDESVADTASLLNDFTERFGTGLNTWPVGLLVYGFEIQAIDRFHNNLTEDQQVNFCNQLRRQEYKGKDIDGWCNG